MGSLPSTKAKPRVLWSWERSLTAPHLPLADWYWGAQSPPVFIVDISFSWSSSLHQLFFFTSSADWALSVAIIWSIIAFTLVNASSSTEVANSELWAPDLPEDCSGLLAQLVGGLLNLDKAEGGVHGIPGLISCENFDRLRNCLDLSEA